MGIYRVVLALFVGGAIAAPVALKHSGLVLNLSKSVPVGLYRRVPAASAAYIGFCLPAATVQEAVRAGLEIGRGECFGNVAPVLKPYIHASTQHPLLYSNRGFTFDGALLPNTAPKARSKQGTPLVHFPFGAYTDGVWAVSDFSRDSFDSRYFGPVESRAILFHATPVLTWR